MRWSSLLLAVMLLAVAAPPAEDKRLSVYSTVANYNLPVVDHDNHEYVGLLEILEPLGSVAARQERERWKLRFNNVDAEFNAGQTRGKVQGRSLELPGRFVLENGRGLVPLASLSTLLPRFLGGPVTFHETARRLFIGNVAVHFTAQIRKSNSPVLVMDFTAPVNPSIATEPGKLRMVFTRDPLVPPGTSTLTFDDKTIPAAIYAEGNGTAEVTISSAVPLFASFSNDRRTITVTPAPQPTAQAGPPAQPLPKVSGSPGSVLPASPGTRFFAIVDASHGGDERGAALSSQLAEKDVTLAIARVLRQQLESRGVATMLLRDSDSTMSLDQRAATVNAVRPAIYLSVHAAAQGNGVRIYTSSVPSGAANRGAFLDWNSAQAASLGLSQMTASSLVSEFQKKQMAARLLVAPLRPLNNVATAAIALEVAPPAGDIADLNSSAYQQTIAATVAAGVAALRDKLEARQ